MRLKFWKKEVVEREETKEENLKIIGVNSYSPTAGRALIELTNKKDFITMVDPNALVLDWDGTYIQELEDVIFTCQK